MNKYLEELHWLNNEENIENKTVNQNLQKAVNTFSKCESILTKRLTGKNLKLFIQAVDAADEMTANVEADSFISGIRLGAKLMMEILG